MATVAEARPDLVERLVNPEDAQLTSGSTASITVKCSDEFSTVPGHRGVEEYSQKVGPFCRGVNGCPWCKRGGMSNKIANYRPDLVEFLAHSEDAYRFSVNSQEKVEVTCNGLRSGNPEHPPSHYTQSVFQLSVGKNGCPLCKRGGTGSTLVSRRPDLIERLVNSNDAKLPTSSDTHVEVLCDGGGAHTTEKYKQMMKSFSQDMNGCPQCGRLGLSNSIGNRFPELVRWLVDEKDSEVAHGTQRVAIKVWCDGESKGNTSHPYVEYFQSPRSFTSGTTSCFLCSGVKSWMHYGKKINFVLEGIIDHIEGLTGAQKMALVLRRHGIKAGSPVGQAILKNDVPALKEIMADLGSEDKDESELSDLVGSGSDDGDFLVPDADVKDSVSDESLPTVSSKEGFAALEALSDIAIGSDESAVRFLVDSAVHRLWQLLYAASDVEAYVSDVRARLEDCGNDYMCEFLGEFLRQYDEASDLEVPERWGFYEPNLMQKHMALLVGERKLVGNWSGTGAGKTASAVLSSMIGERKKILVVCPNNTVNGWKETVEVCDPNAEVVTKSFLPEWSDVSGSKWLIVNFDRFSGREESALKMMSEVDFDMMVIDELHWAKERGGTQVSQRRETLRLVREELSDDAFVLGMSATPVVNDLTEGRSLLSLIEGREPDFDTKHTLNNVQSLHENMVRVGFRAIIPPKVGFAGEEFIDVDISHVKDELLEPGISHVKVDAIVAMEFAETITEQAKAAKERGKGVMVYTEYLTGIDGPLTQYLEDEGLRVAHFTGSHEKADIGSLVGNFDVLIGTQAIGTGVDGVQKWADTVVYATLPWTSAQFEQSRARVYRQGSTAETVRVVIPRGVVMLDDGREWSWTDARWNRIKSKKDLASAAVDGEFPEHVVSSPKEATTAALAMLERMDNSSEQ